jgi:phospholipid/cholesterol/gamma-HCH transport system substrate-binding protein
MNSIDWKIKLILRTRLLFHKISGNFSKISDSLNKADLGKTVKNKTLVKVDGIMKGLEAGNGTMGKLLNDDALYYNLSKLQKS